MSLIARPNKVPREEGVNGPATLRSISTGLKRLFCHICFSFFAFLFFEIF